MDFFTSDLHIGHDKEFIWKERGFSSIEEHDTEILFCWNSVVTPEDTVYILGDLCMGQNEKEWDRVYKSLNGYKKFIYGNHDTNKKIQRYINEYHMEDLNFVYIYKYSKSKIFYLSHYPTYTANFDDDKRFPIINLFGHTHQKNVFFNNNPYMYHVGVDSNNLTPVSIETIIKDIKEFKTFINQDYKI